MMTGWWKLVTCALIIFFSFSGTNEGHAEGKEGWSELNRSSDTILQYVKEQHYEEAANIMETFSEKFLKVSAAEQGLSMREMQTITSAYDDTLSAVKSASMPHEERVMKTYKLRLLMDVYADSYEPLWQKMKDPLFNELHGMRMSIEENGNPYTQQTDVFLAYYGTVEPAWSVALEASQYQKINSQMQFLRKMAAGEPSKKDWERHMDVLEEALIEIFEGKMEDEVTDPSFYWLIITVSGAVFSCLTYAGWKKYRANKAEILRNSLKRNRGQ
ncbi:sporulation protein YpjB [Salipaludibacillus sp. CUR1]|uniref:sporulation protein YpjB n=1 Tax=Salipaludibacillus sp. CUR1 TaxID=2820003 RepID=UPI001E5688B1|nr:sporulation protein YpjB [Salipaludibacillus sp. CUR1]MCE7792155.1 sporulation protein YpjB [Salipaludibacillus sp. CUR1]